MEYDADDEMKGCLLMLIVVAIVVIAIIWTML